MGRDDEALANYRKSIAIRPTAGPYTNMGALLHKKGDFEGALKAHQEALALRPGSAITRRNIGDALLRLGRNAEVLYRSAVVQVLSNDSDAALRTLETAVNRGFSRESIRNDDDWMSMRRDTRFTKLISGETK